MNVSSTIPKDTAVAIFTDEGHVRKLEEIETDLIYFAVSYYDGQIKDVVHHLRISRSKVYRLLRAAEGGLTSRRFPTSRN
jgi:DNA-binding NtrC family response regulator